MPGRGAETSVGVCYIAHDGVADAEYEDPGARAARCPSRRIPDAGATGAETGLLTVQGQGTRGSAVTGPSSRWGQTHGSDPGVHCANTDLSEEPVESQMAPGCASSCGTICPFLQALLFWVLRVRGHGSRSLLEVNSLSRTAAWGATKAFPPSDGGDPGPAGASWGLGLGGPPYGTVPRASCAGTPSGTDVWSQEGPRCRPRPSCPLRASSHARDGPEPRVPGTPGVLPVTARGQQPVLWLVSRFAPHAAGTGVLLCGTASVAAFHTGVGRCSSVVPRTRAWL